MYEILPNGPTGRVVNQIDSKIMRENILAYLPIFSSGDQNVHAINLSLGECGSLKVTLLGFTRVKNNSFFPINHILGLLAGQHPYIEQCESFETI